MKPCHAVASHRNILPEFHPALPSALAPPSPISYAAPHRPAPASAWYVWICGDPEVPSKYLLGPTNDAIPLRLLGRSATWERCAQDALSGAFEQRLPILRLLSAVEAACQGVAVVVGCVCCQDKCPLLGLRPDAKRAAGNLTWLWAGSYGLLHARSSGVKAILL